MRIAKRIAESGLCSRRDAEKLILEGKVSVNGSLIDSPALNVTEEDTVLVKGKPLAAPAKLEVYILNKPVGVITTSKDEKGRQTVFDILPPNLPRLMTIGRLDLNSEGLLLLTTNGDLARYLEHPDTGWTRRYRVRAFGFVTEESLKSLKKGITVDGIQYGSMNVQIEKGEGRNRWYNVSIKEGKNREIRKVFEHLGLSVNRLIRQSYGPFQLGNLPRGKIQKVPNPVIKQQLPERFFK